MYIFLHTVNFLEYLIEIQYSFSYCRVGGVCVVLSALFLSEVAVSNTEEGCNSGCGGGGFRCNLNLQKTFVTLTS